MAPLPLYLIRNKLLSDRAMLGRWGEKICERYLKAKGYRRIARNFSINAGEIDIIMTEGETLVFVEVKARTSEEFSKAQDAVDAAKRRKIIKTAKYFLKKYGFQENPIRFDVVAIILGQKGKPEIRHYEKAFGINY